MPDIIKTLDDTFSWYTNSNAINFYKNTIYMSDSFQYNDFLFHNDLQTIDTGIIQIHTISKEKYESCTEHSKIDYENDEVKVLIMVNTAFFHFMLDTISSILLMNKKFPKIKFVVVNTFQSKDNTFDVFLKTVLKKNNANYDYINNFDHIKINNFYILKPLQHLEYEVNDFYNMCLTNFITNKNILPKKRIYLSRSIMDKNRDIKRVPNEKVLELFFRQNGFEIVAPESIRSIEKQIDFFYQVKTIVSATSSGLLNMIFMQPGGTVIELQTPFKLFDKQSNVIHSSEYLNLSFNKKHIYIGIPNLGSSSELIEEIKNNKKIYDLIISED